MKTISIATCFNYQIPIDQQLELIAKAGFSHVSIGGRWEHAGILNPKDMKHLKNLLTTNNLSIDSIHGPCMDQENAEEMLSYLIDVAVDLSCPTIVIHPLTGFEIDTSLIQEKVRLTLEKIERLNDHLLKSKVELVVENLFPGNALLVLREVLKSNNTVGFCYDASHDQVDGPNDMGLLETLGHRLKAVHLSDRIKPFVDHVIPGEGFINFKAIAEQLAIVDYDKPILLELMMEHSKYQDPEIFLKEAYKAGCKIFDMIQVNRRF